MSPNFSSLLARRGSAVAALGCAAVLVVGCGAAPAGTDSSRAPATRVEVVPVSATTSISASSTSSATTSAQRAGRVRAYGDSVMLGASYALKKRLKAKVNADESRQSWELLKIVRKAAKKGRLTGPVVIHTGTNGTIVRDQLEDTVRPLQRSHRIVLVTVKANRSWTAGNNSILRAVDREFGNVVLADWQKKAGKHSSWTYSDGIHLTPSGRTAYARLVAKAIAR